MVKKKGLGRGLGALIGDSAENDLPPGTPLAVPVQNIDPNPLQPRASIREKDIKSLAESIKDKGVLEPLVVRRAGDRYELIAGERRLRASQLAGLKAVPVIVREATQAEMLELALIENLHRSDLNPVEEAESFQLLAEKFDRTQADIARLTGKDRSTIANTIRLLGLPGPVQDDVRHGRLSAGHARALLALNEAELILGAREEVLMRQLSVRETEALVKRMSAPPKKKRAESRDDAYFQSLSEKMTGRLGAKVRIVTRGRRRVEISYSSNADLERIMKLLGIGPV